MWRIVCFLMSFSMITEEYHPHDYYCKYDTGKYSRRQAGPIKSLVEKAVHSATTVLSYFNRITEIVKDANEALDTFRAIEPMIENFVPSAQTLATAIGKVADVVIEMKLIPQTTTPNPKRITDKELDEETEVNIADMSHDEVSDQLKKIARTIGVKENEKFNNLTQTAGKKFRSLARQKVRQFENLSDTRFRQHSSMIKHQAEEYFTSLEQVQLTQTVSQQQLKQTEIETQQRNIQYETYLKNIKETSNVADPEVEEFLELADEQTYQYQLSLQQLQQIETSSQQQTDQLEKLTKQFKNMSKVQRKKVKNMSEKLVSLSIEQAKEFKNVTAQQYEQFEQVSQKVENVVSNLRQDFNMLWTKQTDIYDVRQKELQIIHEYTSDKYRLLIALSELVSEGFTNLQKDMDQRFDRIEQMLVKLKETSILIGYETDVQNDIRELYNAYAFFLKSIRNITDPDSDSTEIALHNLIRLCCKHEPFDIMSAMYQKTVGQTMQDMNLFQAIYYTYVDTNIDRMMGLFEIIMADLFKTIQLLLICDEITNARGLGVQKALREAYDIAKALDKITATVEENALRILKPDSFVMRDIIDEWRKLDWQESGMYEALGCDDSESNNDFASYAVLSLEKRFYFFKFFVAVYRYNEKMVQLPRKYDHSVVTGNDSVVNISNNMHFFTFILSHKTKQQNQEAISIGDEKILIFTAFTRKNMTNIKHDCLDDILKWTSCTNWEPSLQKQNLKNGIVFYANQHKYLCGNSWASFPYAIKTCYGDKHALFITACF